MKICVGLLVLSAAIMAGAPARAQEEAAVRGLVERFQAAVKAGDLTAAKKLVAPELLQALGDEAGAPPEGAFLHQDALAFLKGELAGNSYQECQIVGVTVRGDQAQVDLKPASGGLILLHLQRETGTWLLAPAPADPFQQFEAEGEAAIKQDQAEMKARVRQEAIDQDIADDVNEDRFR